MDIGVGPCARNSLGRELLLMARAKADTAPAGGKNGDTAAENARARTGMDSHVAERQARQRQGAYQFLRSATESGSRKTGTRVGNLYSTGTAVGPGRDRSERTEEGLRGSVAVRGLGFSVAARRDRG